MKLNGSNIDAIIFGGNPVSAVYFGSTLAWSSAPQPRTLYFLGFQYNSAWSDVNNWFLDSGGQNYAESFPTPIDDVIVLGLVNTESMSIPPTVANFSISGEFVNGDGVTEGNRLEGSLTVTGLATFSGITKNVGTIYGNCVFNDSSQNLGSVNGNATFNGSSYNLYIISGSAVFNDSSSNLGGVNGDAIFNGSSTLGGFVNGFSTFNDASVLACDGYTYGGMEWNSSSPQPQLGCTDSSADNYNATANCEDYSCCYASMGYQSFVECVSCGLANWDYYDSCGAYLYSSSGYDYGQCDYLC